MINFKLKCVSREEENKESGVSLVCEKCDISLIWLSRTRRFICPCCGDIHEIFVTEKEIAEKMMNKSINNIYDIFKKRVKVLKDNTYVMSNEKEVKVNAI